MMILLANILNALGQTASWLLGLLMILVIIGGVLRMVGADPLNPFVRYFAALTDPLFRPIQRRMRPIAGMDLSPIVLFLIIIFVQTFLMGAALDYATALRMAALQAGL